MKTAFLPEFLNRIDETIIFHPLGMNELAKVVDIQLKRLERQLAETGLTLRVTDRAKIKLAEEGFDPAYGARPLKRVIQQRLANPLATALLERRSRKGDVVEIDWNGKDFVFNPVRSGAARPYKPDTAGSMLILLSLRRYPGGRPTAVDHAGQESVPSRWDRT